MCGDDNCGGSSHDCCRKPRDKEGTKCASSDECGNLQLKCGKDGRCRNKCDGDDFCCTNAIGSQPHVTPESDFSVPLVPFARKPTSTVCLRSSLDIKKVSCFFGYFVTPSRIYGCYMWTLPSRWLLPGRRGGLRHAQRVSRRPPLRLRPLQRVRLLPGANGRRGKGLLRQGRVRWGSSLWQ